MFEGLGLFEIEVEVDGCVENDGECDGEREGQESGEDGGRSEVDGDGCGEGQESMSDQLLLTECGPMPSDMWTDLPTDRLPTDQLADQVYN